MPFPFHAVLLRVYIAPFPFDLHSAAVFDSHMLYRSHAVPLPCHEYAVLKATSQGHGKGAAWKRYGLCELPSTVHLPLSALSENGTVVAGERHGTCELAFTEAGERHGTCELAFNEAGERHGMCKSGFIHLFKYFVDFTYTG
jgi:hypothetical protein